MKNTFIWICHDEYPSISLKVIQDYVKQGKTSGRLVFWALLNQRRWKTIKKFEKIPDYLKDNARFCLWKNEAGKGKVPYQTDGKRARANKISTFTDFKSALSALDKFDGLGIGIFNEISAIDIDNCIDEYGNYSDLAKDIMEIFKDSYTEISPSGKGIRIIFIVEKFSYDKKF